MKLFEERKKAEELFLGEFKNKHLVIEELFSIIDDCLEMFEKASKESTYHRICGLTLLKAKNLSLGMFSLILDGLGQEAGALARPLIEYHELLVYFRLDPARVNQAAENKLPPAGKVAKTIGGSFQDFRSHLNDHASHSSFDFHSMNHLLQKPTFEFKKAQPMLPKVIERNTGDLFAMLVLLAIEAINTLQTFELGCADYLADKIEICKNNGFEVFNLYNRLASEK